MNPSNDIEFIAGIWAKHCKLLGENRSSCVWFVLSQLQGDCSATRQEGGKVGKSDRIPCCRCVQRRVGGSSTDFTSMKLLSSLHSENRDGCKSNTAGKGILGPDHSCTVLTNHLERALLQACSGGGGSYGDISDVAPALHDSVIQLNPEFQHVWTSQEATD